jgi:hypothetical protein
VDIKHESAQLQCGATAVQQGGITSCLLLSHSRSSSRSSSRAPSCSLPHSFALSGSRDVSCVNPDKPRQANTSLPLTTMTTSEWSAESLLCLWNSTLHASIETSKIFIKGVDEFNGLEMLQEWDGITTTRSIPQHYGNTLGIITAKIMWLQSGCVHSWRPRNERATATAATVVDHLRRNLVFTFNVREAFFLEVANTFYSKRGVPRRKFCAQDAGFQSKYLDSWLCIELGGSISCQHTCVLAGALDQKTLEGKKLDSEIIILTHLVGIASPGRIRLDFLGPRK